MVHYRHQKKIAMKYKNNRSEKQVRISRWNYCTTKFLQFCKRTDLHGFKYIAMEKLSVTERSVWAVAVVISVVCATFFVIIAYKWYARNPIVTVVESTQGAIWDIPFPAVTICDLNVISKRAALAFSTNLSLPENVTSEFIFRTLKIAPLLHSTTIADPDEKRDLHKLQDILDLNNISLDSLFQQLSPAASCGDLIERCMWKNTIYRCEQIFQHVYAGLNLCCTFNYYAVDDNANEVRFFRYPTPRRVASCGYQTALTLIVRTDPDDYYSTALASRGSLVFIDNAYNIPDMDSPARLVNPATEVMIAVSPERTYATAGIRSFKPHDRQCYYNDEVKIANFHHYSFHNCMALKKVQVLINKCDCIPFYFPQRDYNRICNFHDIECLERVLNPNLIYESEENDQVNKDESTDNMIQCMPECEHFDYPLEVALGKLSVGVPFSGTMFFDDINLENRSVVNVFFNDLVATRYRRDAYLNWQNVLAAFGGLLSLMLGFTLISGFDFVIFFSLKVLYDSISRFFIYEHSDEPKGFIINVKEHEKEHWVKQVKRNRSYEANSNKYNDRHVKIRY
ncbi:unnamed protein product, partial [Brenthis ino]